LGHRVVSLIPFLLLATPSDLMNNDLNGEDLTPLIPENLEHFTLEQIEPREEAAQLQADFQLRAKQTPVTLHLAYGSDREELENKFSELTGQMPLGIYKVQGTSITVANNIEPGRHLLYGSIDNFFIRVVFSGLNEELDFFEELEPAVIELFGEFDATRLLNWELKQDIYNEEDYPLITFFPEKVDDYVITELNFETDELSGHAEYQRNPDGRGMNVAVTFGAAAVFHWFFPTSIIRIGKMYPCISQLILRRVLKKQEKK